MSWTLNKWGELIQTDATLEVPSRASERSSEPSLEPVSLTQAKKQVEVSGSDHDDQLVMLIEAAREQWEHDTGRSLIQQTYTQSLDRFMEFRFWERPVTSITSVTYYDVDNAQQTLASSIYELDTAENGFRLSVDQDWPISYERYDAVTVTYVVGSNTSNASVNGLDKQAMLLLVGYYFENRDMYGADLNMGDARGMISAYEALVRRYQRSSYP